MDEIKITLDDISVPLTPNWIRVKGKGAWHISDFEDYALKEIGERWTANLIAKARKKKLPYK